MKFLSSIPLPLLVLIGVSLVFMLCTLVYYLIVKNKYKHNKNIYTRDAIRIKSRIHKGDALDSFYQSVYLGFVKIPVIKYYTKKIRLKLEMANDYSEYEIRKMTAKYMLFALIFMFTSIFILVNIIKDLYTSLFAILGVLIVTEKIIDIKINSISIKILKQMPEAFTNIRHAFHEHGMVEESFDAAIDELAEKDIGPQLKKIKEAMLSANPETELERYYDTAPNRFLKLFAGVSYLTMELGDRKIEGKSVYLKNLNNILSDIYLEILKIQKLNSRFRNLNIIAVAPLLFVKPLQTWAETNFTALVNFYTSSIGFVVQALIIVSIFVSYLMLRILKDDSEQLKFDRTTSSRWQDKLYKNEFIKSIVDAFKPKKHTKKYRKVTNLIKNTNSYLTMEWLYINKIVAFLITFIAMILLIINIKFIDMNSVFNSISQEFLSFSKLTEEQEEAAKTANIHDREIVEKYKGHSLTKEELKERLRADKGEEVDDKVLDRIYDKMVKSKDIYFKFYELLLAFFVAWIGYTTPTLFLMIKNKIREMEKENEIMQFQSIILMLMYIERIDVQTILEWLARFSYAFKEPIETALNNYESGAIEALEELKEDVPNKDFKRIVEELEAAVERIPIKDAFDELETEREYYYEKRKESIENLILKKYTIGRALAFMPLVILLGGYLVGPMLMVSILQMLQYFTLMGV